MKKLSLLLLVSVLAFWGCSNDDGNGEEFKNKVVVSFEKQLTTENSEYSTDKGIVADPTDPYSYFKYQFKDPTNVVELSHYYSKYGFGGGFTYTNKTDISTPGYTNLSAITAKGNFGKVYLTSKTDSKTPARITNLHTDKYAFKGVWITNTTYAYLAIKDGNDGYLNETKFEANDWFKLTAVGYKADNSKIGSIDFYLADYRNGKSEIINTWKWFDWSSIKDADYIILELSSTDNDPTLGMNTPAYFCMDGITLIEK